MDLSGATFVFIFLCGSEINTETPETNMKIDIFENRHEMNMV
jgi:hypothetical protein